MDTNNDQSQSVSLSDTIPQFMARLRPLTPEQIASQAKREESEKARAAAQRVAVVARQLGRRYSHERCTLETFVCRLDEQHETLRRLKALLPGLGDFIEEGRSLIFHGSVGTGKDHLLAAMLYQAAALGVSVKWIDGQDLFRRFRDGIDAATSEREIVNDLSAPDVLAISDVTPDAKDPTWQQGRLKSIIDRRYRDCRGTWVTMNALSPEDADGKLSTPVFDRLREGAELFRCFWPSWRERRK